MKTDPKKGLIVGALFLLFGFVASLFSGEIFEFYSSANILLGVFCVVIAFALLWRSSASREAVLFSKRARNAILQGVLFVAVLSCLGLGKIALERVLPEWDLTEQSVFELSPVLQETIHKLASPVEVAVVVSSATPTSQLEFLDRVEKLESRLLSLIRIDPVLDPLALKEFEIPSELRGVVVNSASRRRRFLRSLNEEELLNALRFASGASTQSLLFLTGHGEPSLSDDSADGLKKMESVLRSEGVQIVPAQLWETDILRSKKEFLYSLEKKSWSQLKSREFFAF